MAIKKLLINGSLITYTLQPHTDGFNVVVEREKHDAQRFIIQHVTFRGTILQFACNDIIYTATLLKQHDATNVIFNHISQAITVQKQAQHSALFKSSANTLSFGAATVLPRHSTHITSPLAGRVLRILIQPGQRVVSGQPLLVIESMKMENEICAPHAIFIKTIFINPGDVVQQNQSLIDFEKEGMEDVASKNAHEHKAV